MAELNLSKLENISKKVSASLSRGGKKAYNPFWKPKNGTNSIRVLPPWTDEGDFEGQFWREAKQHWGVSDRGPFLCPATTPFMDGECPVCKFIEEQGNVKDPVKREALKDISAKVTYFLNIIDMNDPEYTEADVVEYETSNPDREVPFQAGDPKIQLYAANTTVFNGIISAIQDGENNVTNIKTGQTIKIKKEGSGRTGTNYTVTAVTKQTPAPVKEDTVIPDLGLVGMMLSYEDMRNALAGCDTASMLRSGDDDASSLSSGVDDMEAEMRAALRG